MEIRRIHPPPRFLKLTFLIALFFLNCHHPSADEIVLQVGQMKLTTKEVDRYVKRYQQKHHKEKLTPDETNHYIKNELVDHLLLLNAAYDEGYDTHPEVLKKLKLMQKKFLTAGDGLLYRRFLADSLGIREQDFGTNQHEFQRHLENVAAVLKKRFLDSIQITINQPVFEAFYEKNYRSGHYFRKQILEKFAPEERAQRFFTFNSVDVTLGEWIDYYRSYPVVRIIENKQMLHEHLEQYVFEQLAYHYAQKIGLLNDEKLRRFINSYREKIMVEIFLKEKATAEISITEAEMRKEYEKNRTKYRIEPIVGIITIEFLSYNDAIKIVELYRQKKTSFIELKQKYELSICPRKKNSIFFVFNNSLFTTFRYRLIYK